MRATRSRPAPRGVEKAARAPSPEGTSSQPRSGRRPHRAHRFLGADLIDLVSLEALAPFRLGWQRDESDPQPLEYLQSMDNADNGAIDIRLEAYILSSKMESENVPAMKLSQSSFKYSYWTIAQLVTHHSMNGCNLTPGDLLGSGTQSGPLPEEAGSILELSSGGKSPITLPTGEQRSFLEDGDTIIFKGGCSRTDAVQIGFGEVRGTVLPAVSALK